MRPTGTMSCPGGDATTDPCSRSKAARVPTGIEKAGRLRSPLQRRIPWEERIVKFISALRSGGVRVSLAESTDAFSAVENLGVQDRDTFRLSLRATLVKDVESLPTFEELFPLFFGSGEPPPLMNLMEDLTEEEANMLAEALQEYGQRLREMLDRLLRGEQLSPEELEGLGQMVGLHQADDLRYREWMARRMQRALQFEQVRKAMQEIMELMAQMGMNKERLEQLRQLIGQNMDSLREQLRQHAGQRIAEKNGRAASGGSSRRADGSSLPGPVRQRHAEVAPGSAAAGRTPAQPHRPPPEKGQDRSTRRQSDDPCQPQARRGPISDQTPGPHHQTKAGGDLRHQHLHASLLRTNALSPLRVAGSSEQVPRLRLHRPPGVHHARLSGQPGQ